MDRRKFSAMFIVLAVGFLLSAGRESARAAGYVELSGYLMGDPAPGKLVPYYRVGPNLATIIGFDNLESGGLIGGSGGLDIGVHVVIFSKRSSRIANFFLCLSPFDFGFLVLQQNPPSPAQQAELAQRFAKARIYSVNGDGIPTEGYVTLKAVAKYNSHDGTCGQFKDDEVDSFFDPFGYNALGVSEPLAAWTILQDVGTGFFGTEVPTFTAKVTSPGESSVADGAAFGGVASPGFDGVGGSYGLIPGPPLSGTPNPFDESCWVASPNPSNTNRVIVRYDVNPNISSKTEIFIWLARNAFVVSNDPGAGCFRGGATTSVFIHCEDELTLSGFIPTPDEVNVITLDSQIPSSLLAGMNQCNQLGQYRGVLEFLMPDTGQLWSHISQEGEHFRENFLGYNADCNIFIDPECEGVD
jgi:hypothetical protein